MDATIVIMLLLILGVLAGMALLWYQLGQRREDRVRRILAGEHWAAWEFSPEFVRRVPRLAQQEIRTIYLAEPGIVFMGKEPRLLEFGEGLIDVRLEEPQTDQEPLHLTFVYRTRNQQAVVDTSSSAGWLGFLLNLIALLSPADQRLLVRVPVPPERHAEAAVLASRIRIEIDRAPKGQRTGVSQDRTFTAWVTFALFVGIVCIGGLLIPTSLSSSSRTRQQAEGTARVNIRATENRAWANALATVRRVLTESRIAAMQRAAEPGQVYHISGEAAGFSAEDRIETVVYGYCASEDFYIYVINAPSGSAETEVEGIMHGSDPRFCTPPGWVIQSRLMIAPEWYRYRAETLLATLGPTLTPLKLTLEARTQVAATRTAEAGQ